MSSIITFCSKIEHYKSNLEHYKLYILAKIVYRYTFNILPNCDLVGKIVHFNSKKEHYRKFKLGDINTYKYARNIHFVIWLSDRQ